MTQAIDRIETILAKLDNLTPEQQDEVLDFIDFLQFKTKKQELQELDKEAISAYEAARDFAGCVDFGPGDLATNKEYLKRMGKKSNEKKRIT